MQKLKSSGKDVWNINYYINLTNIINLFSFYELQRLKLIVGKDTFDRSFNYITCSKFSSNEKIQILNEKIERGETLGYNMYKNCSKEIKNELLKNKNYSYLRLIKYYEDSFISDLNHKEILEIYNDNTLLTFFLNNNYIYKYAQNLSIE